MPLHPKEAINLGLVTDRNGRKLDFAKYDTSTVDVTIREILSKNVAGDIISVSGGALDPQQSVYIISEETIHVPMGYVAYVFLKNRLSQQGLLAFNTGIIDEGFYGPISTLVTNLSKETTPIPKADTEDRSFFRIVFHKVSDLNERYISFKMPKHTPQDTYKRYQEYRKEDLARLPNSFLDPEKIKSQISLELTNKLSSISLARLGSLVTVLALLFSLIPLAKHELYDSFMNSTQTKEAELIKSLETRIDRLESTLMRVNLRDYRASNDTDKD